MAAIIPAVGSAPGLPPKAAIIAPMKKITARIIRGIA
jgi:hypothetical protein